MKTLYPSSRPLETLSLTNVSEGNTAARPSPSNEGRPQLLRWIEVDAFVVDTVLGLHRTRALVLDETSKHKLDIPEERLVVLPGEERRARMEQVKDYCDRVLRDSLPVNGFEVAYLLEFFDTSRSTLSKCLGLSDPSFDAIVDEDDAFDPCSSQKVALFFLHAWNMRRGEPTAHS